MKKLRIVLPVAIVLIAAGAAFATNATKSTGNNLVPGYLYNSSTHQCEQKRTDCSRNGNVYCTWSDASGSHILSEMINGTTCVDELFEP